MSFYWHCPPPTQSYSPSTSNFGENPGYPLLSDPCDTCASLQKFPGSLANQSSDEPLEVIGMSYAADIIRRYCQFISLLRECTNAYSVSCLVPDEKRDILRDALAQLILSYTHSMVHMQSYVLTLHQDLFHLRTQMPYGTLVSQLK